MRIATWNINGIRARFDDVTRWVERCQPDIFCLQELKAAASQVPEPLTGLPGYHNHWHGDFGGYSGVSLHVRRDLACKRPPFHNPDFDMETRIVTTQLDNLVVASVYVPNGNKSYPDKVNFLRGLIAYAKDVLSGGKELLICGDLNVTMTPQDIHASQRRPNAIGQLPEERRLMQELLDCGLFDVGRQLRPNDDGLFTWWPPWRGEKLKNHGWRIDYILASQAQFKSASRCEVLVHEGTSDHAPVMADFVSTY